MPLRNQVIPLEELAKKKIYEFLESHKETIIRNGYKWRLFFIGNLPGDIRTDFLCYGCPKRKRWWNTGHSLSQWVPISVALFDAGIKHIPPICIYNFTNDLPLLVTFISYLWIHRPKITELLMDLVHVNKNCQVQNNCIQFAVRIMRKYFDEGLATKLVQLQLTYQCDDSMLNAIGRYAMCLKILDVSCSPNVTVNGIKGLLFKDNKTIKFMTNESMTQLYQYLRLINRSRDVLNSICFTLEEVRLQNTKANNNLGWLLILSCVQSLKKIEWPGKRNIMKIIMNVWRQILKPESLYLQLDTLFDWEITYDELYEMTECLPRLKKLSTSLTRNYEPSDNSSRKRLQKFWHNLHSLTLYMENTAIVYFQRFCQNGFAQNLSELTIKTFSSDIIFDLALLQGSCPNLKTLDIASVSLTIDLEPSGKFKYLKRVVMESPSTDTKTWLLLHGCPVLEEFKIFNEIDPEYWMNIFNIPPPLIRERIKHLEILFILPDGNSDLLRPPFIINHSTVTEFIIKCSVLNLFGSIQNFMTTEDVESVNNFIRMHNYSLTIY